MGSTIGTKRKRWLSKEGKIGVAWTYKDLYKSFDHRSIYSRWHTDIGSFQEC